MYNFIGYLFILILITLLGTFFVISTKIERNRIQRKATIEINKLQYINELINLKKHIDSNSSKHIKAGSFEYMYLSQIDFILNNDPYNLDKIEISPVNFKKSNNGLNALESYRRAPASVKKDMDSLSEILGKIYQLQHPLKYKLLRLKKIIIEHILALLVAFLAIAIKILERWCETNKKGRITKMKKRQKAVQNVPASVWLNINPNQGEIPNFA